MFTRPSICVFRSNDRSIQDRLITDHYLKCNSRITTSSSPATCSMFGPSDLWLIAKKYGGSFKLERHMNYYTSWSSLLSYDQKQILKDQGKVTCTEHSRWSMSDKKKQYNKTAHHRKQNEQTRRNCMRNTKQPGPSYSKLNEVVSWSDVKISILK